MPLSLSDAELEEIRHFQTLLTQPLRFSSSEAWMKALHRSGTDLFGVERSASLLPTAEGPSIDSLNLEDRIRKGLTRAITGTDANRNRYADPVLDRAMGRMAAAGTQAWNRDVVERVGGVLMEETPWFYPEVVRPGALEDLTMMGASLPEGRAMFGIFPERHQATRFDGGTLDVFRLLQPAFSAGCRTLNRTTHLRRKLGTAFDDVDVAVSVYRNGNPVHRNRAMRRLLARDPERADIVARMDACFREVVHASRGSPDSDFDGEASAVVRTDLDRYRIRAAVLDPGLDGGPETIVVLLRTDGPVLPDEGELRSRYGLTPRQAEVALLLARGHSNREIGARLGISSHTARHHAQRVLEKSGAGGRKALALHFLTDGSGSGG